jgi:hypothetical protein
MSAGLGRALIDHAKSISAGRKKSGQQLPRFHNALRKLALAKISVHAT